MKKSVGKKSQESIENSEKSAEKIEKTQKTFLKKWNFLIAAFIFLITTSIFFGDILFGNSFLWEDVAEAVYPIQSYAAKESLSDGIPFWTPFVFGGLPFFADLQVGFFYPLNRIYSLFVGSDGNVPASVMHFIQILHFFIAQLSMYFFMRTLKVSFFGSLISAISYTFSFFLVLHSIHPMIIAHLAWFPLVFAFVYKAIKQKSIKFSIIAGLIFGTSFLAGHPQSLLYETFFLGIFVAWFFISDLMKKEIFENKENSGNKENTKAKEILKYVARIAIPFVVAVGIFMIQYLPTNELTKNTLRNQMTYEKAGESSIDVKQIFTAVVPKMYGSEQGDRNPDLRFNLQTYNGAGEPITAPYYYYWETGFYFGIVALVFAIFGFLTTTKKRLTAFFIAVSIFGFLFALGSNGPLLSIFINIPLFNTFRGQSKMILLLIFAFTTMAGIGFDKLLNTKASNNNKLDNEKANENKSVNFKMLISIGIPLLFAILVRAGLFGINNDLKSQELVAAFANNTLILIVLTAGLMFVLNLFNKKNNTNLNYLIGFALVVICFTDLFIAGSDFPKSPVDYTEKYKLNPEMQQNFEPKYPNALFRVSSRITEYGVLTMQRNGGLMSGIMLVEGYNPLILARYDLPLKTREDKNMLWNVKYEVTLDTATNQIYFRERNDQVERAWLVGKKQIVQTSEIKDFMMNNEIDYKTTVLLEKDMNLNLPQELDTNANVKFLDYQNDEMKLESNCQTNSILVLSEVFYPEWKAYVDGKPVEIYQANYNFRAIPLEAGKHIIEMRFESSAFTKGASISLITLLLSIFGIIFCQIRKK